MAKSNKHAKRRHARDPRRKGSKTSRPPQRKNTVSGGDAPRSKSPEALAHQRALEQLRADQFCLTSKDVAQALMQLRVVKPLLQTLCESDHTVLQQVEQQLEDEPRLREPGRREPLAKTFLAAGDLLRAHTRYVEASAVYEAGDALFYEQRGSIATETQLKSRWGETLLRLGQTRDAQDILSCAYVSSEALTSARERAYVCELLAETCAQLGDRKGEVEYYLEAFFHPRPDFDADCLPDFCYMLAEGMLEEGELEEGELEAGGLSTSAALGFCAYRLLVDEGRLNHTAPVLSWLLSCAVWDQSGIFRAALLPVWSLEQSLGRPQALEIKRALTHWCGPEVLGNLEQESARVAQKLETHLAKTLKRLVALEKSQTVWN